jgi:hypothetical protein
MVTILISLTLFITSCNKAQDDTVVPTLASYDTLPTAIFLTENAPPAGFSVVNFDPVDLHLSDRQGWVYKITGQFDGTFDDSGQPAQGTLDIQVQANELGAARRVVFSAEGLAFLVDEAILKLEGVRFSNDYYLVDVNGRCTSDPGGKLGGAEIADLSAGQVIGGVQRAQPTGHRQDIGGIPAWQYGFTTDAVRLPAVHLGADSTVSLQADLWIAPQTNAVLRYEVTAQVTRVHLLWADLAAPTVSGKLYLRYELSIPDLDVLPNISVPHGC